MSQDKKRFTQLFRRIVIPSIGSLVQNTGNSLPEVLDGIGLELHDYESFIDGTASATPAQTNNIADNLQLSAADRRLLLQGSTRFESEVVRLAQEKTARDAVEQAQQNANPNSQRP